MSTDYRLRKRVPACDLFDGRLEEFNVREHVKSDETTKTSRCLTDGRPYLWVYADDDGLVSSLTRYAPNGVPSIMFANLDEALAARRELSHAGYTFEILPGIDPYSQAIFTEVWRSGAARLDEDVLWKQLQAIVEPMGSEVDNGGLIEDPHRERHLHSLQ